MLGEILERRRIVTQPSLVQNMPLAVVEAGHRIAQQVTAQAQLLLLAEAGFLAFVLVDQPILPLALAIRPQRRIQRMIGARQPSIHVDDVDFRHIQLGRDLRQMFRRQIAFFDGLDAALHLAQVEKQLFLRRRGAHLHQ